MTSNRQAVTAQVSIYVIGEPKIAPALEEFLDIVRDADLQVQVGRMSTLIEGDAEEVFDALSAAFEGLAGDHRVVLQATISNTCPAEDHPPMVG